MISRFMRACNTAGRLLALSAAALLPLAGCHKDPPPTVKPITAAAYSGVTFADATAQTGIQFKHVTGAFGQKWLPETMGSGLAWIDVDGDGFQDLFLVNGREWSAEERALGHQPGSPASGAPATCHLYHNNGNGTFTDITHAAHLDIPMYGMGVTVGDYDNDGRPDIFVTSLTRCYLFHNNGDGTFTEVAEKAGLKDSGWSSSAAWVDYDRDGKLDLVVCHYVKWSPDTDIPFMQNGHRSYGTPQKYVGLPPTLYHNNGNGTFTDVSEKAGFRTSGSRKLQGKSLGVAICDYDNDGWPDIAIANDTEPNYLFHNKKDGTFEEVGVDLGMAYPDNGAARGAMGIDACDYDRKGRENLLIGNFSNQQLAMYHNENGATFRDVASQNGIGPASLLSLSFGLFFFDFDNDGWQDLFIANGHVDDDVEEVQKQVLYAEQPLIFHNLANGNFQDVSTSLGTDIQKKAVARGAAFADIKLRGWLDIATSTSNGPAHIFVNSGGAAKSLRLELEGTKSNRSAIGAMVTVKVGGSTQTYRVHAGSSYCSQCELPITVGLGNAASADSITITWPAQNAQPTVLNGVAAGSIYHVIEGEAQPRVRPFGQAYKK